jgi:streptogramin lyase
MRILTITFTILLCAALAPSANARALPETIPLPNGWQPEGIATDHHKNFYSGSRATGAIFKGSLKSGKGDVLVQPWGGAALGMKVDHRGRLFVAGGGTGTASIYNARNGKLLRRYTLTAAPTFINDVTLTERAAYFTDSMKRQLYVLDLGRHGKLPTASRTLPLTGDLANIPAPGGFELNGIAAAGHGRLVTVNSALKTLFLVDARSGATDAIELTGGDVANGDGLLLLGRRLYVVQNQLNRIAVIHLKRGLRSGEIKRYLTDSDLDVPTTIAWARGFLWAVNARFSTPPTPDTTYLVVRVTP